MTKYREILRLSSLGFSNRNIALSVPCSRNTVSKVLKRAKELNLSWPLSCLLYTSVIQIYSPKCKWQYRISSRNGDIKAIGKRKGKISIAIVRTFAYKIDRKTTHERRCFIWLQNQQIYM